MGLVPLVQAVAGTRDGLHGAPWRDTVASGGCPVYAVLPPYLAQSGQHAPSGRIGGGGTYTRERPWLVGSHLARAPGRFTSYRDDSLGVMGSVDLLVHK